MNTESPNDHLRYRWLSAINEHISPAGQQIWRDLKERYGVSERLDRLHWMSDVMTLTPRTPVDQETLNSWSVEDVVRFCAAYTGPEESFDGDSKEGLAQALSMQVQNRPAEFASEAMRFCAFVNPDRGDNPRFVVSFFEGLRYWVKAAKGNSPRLSEAVGVALSSPVTKLIQWTRNRKAAESTPHVPTWETARREAAELLLVSLEGLYRLPPDQIATILEENADQILLSLRGLQDADEPRMGEDDDPINTCLNSTRGKALHAAVAFQSCWAKGNKLRVGTEELAPGLNEEVANLFQERLRLERSPAVRCVFGWHLPYLNHVSPQWVAEHLEQILPADVADRGIWQAVFDAYIGFNSLYKSVWSLLAAQYRRACERIAQRRSESMHSKDIDAKLGQHIFLAWFAGFGDADSILLSFLSGSKDELRSHMVRFGARIIEDNISSKGLSVDSPEWEKMERFWRSRVLQQGALGAARCESNEAAAFVSWLAFSPAPLPRLVPLIEAMIPPMSTAEQDWEKGKLLDYLADQSSSHPLESAKLMERLARAGWPRWLTPEQSSVVISALQQGRAVPEGKSVVEKAVAALSKQGFFDYRQALRDGGDDDGTAE